MGGGEKLFNLYQRLMRAPAGFGSGLWTRRENRFATDSPLEGAGFEPVWGLFLSSNHFRLVGGSLFVAGMPFFQWDVAAARKLLADECQHPRQTARVSALSRSRGHRRLSQAMCGNRGEGLRGFHPRLAVSPPAAETEVCATLRWSKQNSNPRSPVGETDI